MNNVRGLAAISYADKIFLLAIQVDGGLNALKSTCAGCSLFPLHGDEIRKDVDELLDTTKLLKELFDGKKKE